jgi:hypothetical protein
VYFNIIVVKHIRNLVFMIHRWYSVLWHCTFCLHLQNNMQNCCLYVIITQKTKFLPPWIFKSHISIYMCLYTCTHRQSCVCAFFKTNNENTAIMYTSIQWDWNYHNLAWTCKYNRDGFLFHVSDIYFPICVGPNFFGTINKNSFHLKDHIYWP